MKTRRADEGGNFALGVASASGSSVKTLPTAPELDRKTIGAGPPGVDTDLEVERDATDPEGAGLNMETGSWVGSLALEGTDWVPEEVLADARWKESGLCWFTLLEERFPCIANPPVEIEADEGINGVFPRRDSEEAGRDIAESGRGLGLGLAGTPSVVEVCSSSFCITVPNSRPPVD